MTDFVTDENTPCTKPSQHEVHAFHRTNAGGHLLRCGSGHKGSGTALGRWKYWGGESHWAGGRSLRTQQSQYYKILVIRPAFQGSARDVSLMEMLTWKDRK